MVLKLRIKKARAEPWKKIGKYRIELCPKKNNLDIEKACKNHYYQLSEFFNCLEVTYTYKIYWLDKVCICNFQS